MQATCRAVAHCVAYSCWEHVHCLAASTCTIVPKTKLCTWSNCQQVVVLLLSMFEAWYKQFMSSVIGTALPSDTHGLLIQHKCMRCAVHCIG